ncbi:hypothetical protein EYR36_007073 [Pleurotus pulmonarius]|nr:hypothetical protein EYR36_007073 [Pleurotus pulmonarius]
MVETKSALVAHDDVLVSPRKLQVRAVYGPVRIATNGHQRSRIIPKSESLGESSKRRSHLFMGYGAIALNGDYDKEHAIVPDFDPASPESVYSHRSQSSSPMSSPTLTTAEPLSPTPQSKRNSLQAYMLRSEYSDFRRSATIATESTPLVPKPLLLANKYNGTADTHITPTTWLTRLFGFLWHILGCLRKRTKASRRRSAVSLKLLILPQRIKGTGGEDDGLIRTPVLKRWWSLS